MQMWRYAVAHDYAKNGLGDLSNFEGALLRTPEAEDRSVAALSF